MSVGHKMGLSSFSNLFPPPFTHSFHVQSGLLVVGEAHELVLPVHECLGRHQRSCNGIGEGTFTNCIIIF
jgi:hypothetical protein